MYDDEPGNRFLRAKHRGGESGHGFPSCAGYRRWLIRFGVAIAVSASRKEAPAGSAMGGVTSQAIEPAAKAIFPGASEEHDQSPDDEHPVEAQFALGHHHTGTTTAIEGDFEERRTLLGAYGQRTKEDRGREHQQQNQEIGRRTTDTHAQH